MAKAAVVSVRTNLVLSAFPSLGCAVWVGVVVSNLLLSPKFRAIRHRHIFRRPSLGSKVGRSLAAAGKAEQMKLQYPSQMAGGTCAIQALRHHPSSGTPFSFETRPSARVAASGSRQDAGARSSLIYALSLRRQVA